MSTFTIVEMIMKLVGRIYPVGETNSDARSQKALEHLCMIVEQLIIKIDEVAYENRNRQEASIKKSADFARDFLSNKLNIKE